MVNRPNSLFPPCKCAVNPFSTVLILTCFGLSAGVDASVVNPCSNGINLNCYRYTPHQGVHRNAGSTALLVIFLPSCQRTTSSHYHFTPICREQGVHKLSRSILIFSLSMTNIKSLEKLSFKQRDIEGNSRLKSDCSV